MNVESQASNEGRPVCPSGTWSGFWLQGGREWTMWATLEFTAAGVSGVGADAVGPFRVVGGYGEHGVVFWIKSYAVRSVHYRGYYDPKERCLSGKYRCDGGGGAHFWLWAPDRMAGTNANPVRQA